VWHELLNNEKSKFDSKGSKPLINKRAWVNRDHRQKNRHCWTCNKSLYGPGLKYKGKPKSLPVYHLAFYSINWKSMNFVF